MRHLAFVILFLLLGCHGDPADADADEAATQEAPKAESGDWIVPAGAQARFEKDRKECVGQAVARTTRRADARDFEHCMEERGWKRR